MADPGQNALEALRAEISGLRSELRSFASKLERVQPGGASSVPYLSAAQVRSRIGASATTLWRWIREGRFPRPKYTPGGRRVWPADAIEAWEAGLAAAPTPMPQRPGTA